MRVLGIDTATPVASVGIADQQGVQAECSARSAGSHAQTLLPLIDETLHEARLTLGEIGGLAISIGPGSFTGLRIGLAVVKGLAFSAALPVSAVPTLEALAVAVESPGLVCPILDARKAEVYAALFRVGSGFVEEALWPEAAVPPGELLHAVAPLVSEQCVFVGDGVDRYGAEIVSCLGGRAVLRPLSCGYPRGGVVATMGRERLMAGHDDPVGPLTPRYLRPSQAECSDRRSVDR